MIVKAFKNKIFSLKSPADYPNYASEERAPTSSSDLSINSSPKDAIAASSRSNPDLSESISPRISLDLSKSSDSEDKLLKAKSFDIFGKLLIALDRILDPELVDKYFYENSLKEIAKQLKSLRRQDNKLTEYNSKKVLLVVGLLMLENDIKNMTEDEVKINKLGLLKNIVRKIVDAVQRLDDGKSDAE